LDSLMPAAELIPYTVQSPLYSDGAFKQRWLRLPPGARVGVPGAGPIQFAPSGAYAFPDGTVFVKHFELALDERAPEIRRRLETRFLVAARGGYYGITYKWNAEG